MKMKLKWDGDSRFTSESETGASVTVDTGVAYGATGEYSTPMELLLVALAGCAGIDLVMILQKMRVNLSKVAIEVEARRREEGPRYFEEIRIVYRISGEGLTEQKAGRAASLATDKYCSVGIMLREKAEITHRVEIE
jgi:putative redox protein